MLGPVNVWFDRFIDRRIEIDDAREIHNDIDSTFELLKILGRYAAQWLVQIAFDHLHLLTYDTLAAETLDHRPNRRRLKDLVIKALLARNILLPANLHDEAHQFWKPIQQHRKENLADESRAAEKQ